MALTPNMNNQITPGEPQLTDRSTSKNWIILTFTILVGSAGLIPVPFIDEFIALQLKRRMVYSLARLSKVDISRGEISQLAGSSYPGWSGGCLSTITYPMREAFREVLPWLEWRRAINLATETYYTGVLFWEILSSGSFQPGQAREYRIVIKRVQTGADLRLVASLIEKTFKTGGKNIATTYSWIWRFFYHYYKQSGRYLLVKTRSLVSKRLSHRAFVKLLNRMEKLDPEQLIENARPEVNQLTGKLVQNLNGGLGTLGPEHISLLRQRLFAELYQAGLLSK